MLFLLPIRIGRYTIHIRTMRYGSHTHGVLRSSGWLGRQLWRIPWLPVMRPEHLSISRHAMSVGTLVFPLPFRELHIEIYRHEPGTAARD